MPANIGAELQALPLEYMLGTPLTAAIKAQALAAQTTIDFIEKIGLQEDPNSVTGDELIVRSADGIHYLKIFDGWMESYS